MKGLATWQRGTTAGRAALGALAIAAIVTISGGAATANERIAFLSEQGTTSAPIGWRQFCRDNPAECRVAPMRADMVRADWAEHSMARLSDLPTRTLDADRFNRMRAPASARRVEGGRGAQ